MEMSGALSQSSQFAWHPIPALRRHPLVGFFVLAFGFSWLVILLLSLLRLPSALAITLATVGPTFAAVMMTALIDGRPGLRRLLRRLTL